MKTLLIAFLILIHLPILNSGEPKELKEIRDELKLAILNLFPDIDKASTHTLSSTDISDRIKSYQFNFILKNVTQKISSKNLESYNDQLQEFLEKLNHRPELTHLPAGRSYHEFPFRKYAKDESPEIIPELKYTYRGDSLFYQLKIKFNKRNNNVLIVMCDLILNFPAPLKSDLLIKNVLINHSFKEKEYHYDINFDLFNSTSVVKTIITDSFNKSFSKGEFIGDYTLYIGKKGAFAKYLQLDRVKRFKLKAGDSYSFNFKTTASEKLKYLMIHYLIEDVFEKESEVWSGKASSKLITLGN